MLQLLDAAFLALRGHRRDAQLLGHLLAFEQTDGIQKGLRLCECVGHHVTKAVPGANQAGDGSVPPEFVSERSVGASRSAAP